MSTAHDPHVDPRVDPTSTVPGPSPETEAERRADLRRHKRIATGLLVLATLIYLFCRWLEAT
ncbi:MAG TPA: DUF445 domain-containing protein, partial [Corynebacterium variabile]|nr:DUF445 domain-containing protein [Corynebacterium variabile]